MLIEKGKSWEVTPLCIFRTIWRERIKRAFEDCEGADKTLKSAFSYNLWDWIRLYLEDNFLPFFKLVRASLWWAY